jgi:hypothetical protein
VRIRAIHDDEFRSPLTTMGFINRYLEDLDIAVVRVVHSHTPPSSNVRTRGWIAPDGDAAKINVDGGISHHNGTCVADA